MSLKNFLTDKWPEFLIVGLLSMLLYTVFFDVRDRLARTETANQDTKERLDRIAEALPNMNIQLASEYKYLPVHTAMLVSTPLKTDAGWFSQASIVNSSDGSVDVLQFPLNGPNDQVASWIMLGAIRTENQKALSIEEVQKYLAGGILTEILKNPQVMTGASFAYLKDSDDLKGRLIKAGAREIKSTNFKPGVYSWDEFAKGVNDGSISLGWTEK
jgi:hypothetical protein